MSFAKRIHAGFARVSRRVAEIVAVIPPPRKLKDALRAVINEEPTP